MIHTIQLTTEVRAAVLRTLRSRQSTLEIEVKRCDDMNTQNFSKSVFNQMVALRIELRNIKTAIDALWSSRGEILHENSA